MTRTCGTCTKCCDGWLTVNVRGHVAKNGNPCKFRGNGCCQIYAERPSVCREFECGWLTDTEEVFEDWMKPEIVDFILVFSRVGKLEWYRLVETGKSIDTLMLSYIVQKVINKQINLEYWINDTQFLIGTDEFKKYVKKLAG